jgi:hypothetical protein
MSSPLITKAAVVEYLRAVAKEQSLPVQVQDTYPSVDDNVAYGVYVADIEATSRVPYKLAIQKCGAIYIVTDEMNIMFVSYQNDPQAGVILRAINTLVTDSKFWDGYIEQDMTQVGSIGNRNEIYTFTLSMQRLDFNTNTN